MSKVSKNIETSVHKFTGGHAQVDATLKFQCRTKIHYHDASLDGYIDHVVSNSRKQLIYEVFGEYIKELSEINAMLWGDGSYEMRNKVSDRLMVLMDKMGKDE
jgi:hypothetical protein